MLTEELFLGGWDYNVMWLGLGSALGPTSSLTIEIQI